MRNRFHALCPYFAMFPESFVANHLANASTNEVILDPFSGRGTTVFESLLSGRKAFGIDINPLAVCVSRAKARVPNLKKIKKRIEELRRESQINETSSIENAFFKDCFHPHTIDQLLFLRKNLRWRYDDVDCFVAAMAASCLHGESHKSQRVFSNRMPRTIATKPAYSIKWWREHGYSPPKRDVFEILLAEAEFRFQSTPPKLKGQIVESDVRLAAKALNHIEGSVGLVVTSPPYLNVTNFREDQWLRVWFLGGVPEPCSASEGDDRHVNSENYWSFIADSWKGIAPLLKKRACIAVRIGGKGLTESRTQTLLHSSLTLAFKKVKLEIATTSDIRNGQLRSFRPGAAGIKREFDFVFAVSA
jgi:DNA modification methylase